MGKIDEVEHLLDTMTRGEKAQLLQHIARDLGDAYPGIDSAPDICGGEPHIVRTRIPVWILVQARNLGTDEAEILQDYPTLNAEDLATSEVPSVHAIEVVAGDLTLTVDLQAQEQLAVERANEGDVERT